MIHALYEVMNYTNKEYFEFDVNDPNTPGIVNQNNKMKYLVYTVYMPNVGGEKYFIELDVYNPYDWQYYNIILTEDEWDENILSSIYDIIYNNITNEKSKTC